jgi:Endonuclease NucS
MPLELGVWRIDSGLTSLDASKMSDEARLEDILFKDISVASPNWMVIGRQVPTAYGSFIDLLAMDRDGNLVVLELKRDKTPRDVVAQILDYGSWVRVLKDEDIASIYEDFLKKYYPSLTKTSLDDAFRKQFGLPAMPETLNESHELVVVASALDPSTERIISYLSEVHDVSVSAVFFRMYQDGDREYLTRAWLIEPTAAESKPTSTVGEWNDEFYVSFGNGKSRSWEDAVKYGFISAGNGSWFTKTLKLLEPGARVWVNVPQTGYVGVGEVTSPSVRVADFSVIVDGSSKPIKELPLKAPNMLHNIDNGSTTSTTTSCASTSLA